MSWREGPFLSFDVESTGPDPDFARIVTATVVEIHGADVQVHEWLVNPGVDIPAGAQAVHGISTERARENGMEPSQAVFEITGLLGLWLHRGRPVVAFNASYDLTVLDRECRRHGVATLAERLDGPVTPVIDPHVQDKAVDRYRKGKRTLTATCEHYGVDLGTAHEATADALGAARVAYMIAARFPDECDVDLLTLHERQVVWRAEQAASLEAYFRKTRPDAVVNGEWPVQSLPDGWESNSHPVDDEAAIA